MKHIKDNASQKTTPIIGIFDSGLGGLTVTRSIMNKSPQLPLIYFGDTARFPYGSKSPETIRKYSIENTIFLMEQGATAVVVACNTATAVALDYLQKTFSIPIIGVIEPAALEATKITKTKKIGVIGTTGTIRSKSYEKAIHTIDPSINVYSKACPLLVTLIEEGSPHRSLTDKIISAYINPLLRKGIDTLLLGCTHYPLMKEEIKNIVGERITLIDPAESCSSYLQSQIPTCYQIKNPPTEIISSQIRFYASDDSRRFLKIGRKFLGMPIKTVCRPS